MQLDPMRLAIALAGATAILWIVCAIFVALTPGMMTDMSGNMMHGEMTGWRWSLTIGGFIYGLIGWAVLGAVFGALVAVIYNRVGGRSGGS